METDILKNTEGRISILKTDLISELDNSIHRMKSEHAAKGLSRSGATVQRVMEDINSAINRYHSEILEHVDVLPLTYSPDLEANIKAIVGEGFIILCESAYIRLKEITELVGKPNLYERVLSEVQDGDTKSSNRFGNDLNALTIGLSESYSTGGKPWEEELVKIWRFATKGKRKVFTIPLLAIFVLVPATAGLFDSYSEIWSRLSSVIFQEQSIPSKGESDVFNEWVIAIGHAESEQKAIEMKSAFVEAYVASGHVNYKNEPIWTNDIFHVRHPSKKKVWLVVIDAFSGPSTEKLVTEELNELAELAFSNRQLTNTLGHYLYGSQVMFYSKDELINTYGEIIGQ